MWLYGAAPPFGEGSEGNTMKRAALLALICWLALPVLAQTPSGQEQGPPPPGQGERPRPGMRGGFAGRGVAGTITEIKSDGFVLKNMEGKTVTIKTTDKTEFRNGREAGKLSDLKVGDNVAVMGTPAGEDAWTAERVFNRTGLMMMQMQEGQGKEFIAGEVKAIDGTKLTILRPDNQTQTIEVDENTSFHKQRESITLADIKVGDHVMGRGAVKDGVFVPTTLNVGDFMRMRRAGPQQPQN